MANEYAPVTYEQPFADCSLRDGTYCIEKSFNSTKHVCDRAKRRPKWCPLRLTLGLAEKDRK